MLEQGPRNSEHRLSMLIQEKIAYFLEDQQSFENFLNFCKEVVGKLSSAKKIDVVAELTRNDTLQSRIAEDSHNKQTWDTFLQSLFPKREKLDYSPTPKEKKILETLSDTLSDLTPITIVYENGVEESLDLRSIILQKIKTDLQQTLHADRKKSTAQRINESIHSGLMKTAQDISDLSCNPETWNAAQDVLDRATEMLCAETLSESRATLTASRQSIKNFIKKPEVGDIFNFLFPLIENVHAKRALRTLITSDNHRDYQSLFLSFFSRTWWNPYLFEKERERPQSHIQKTMRCIFKERLPFALNMRNTETREAISMLEELWQEYSLPKTQHGERKILPFSRLQK